MKALFLAWQDTETRRWIPVAKLTRDRGLYRFSYTAGALESPNFVPFGRLKDMRTAYVSNELFPLFANRILPKSRPEYRDYLRWLGLEFASDDALELLSRSGGQRATDSLEIIPCPEPTEDQKYVVYFFSHGVRYLKASDQEAVSSLKTGQRLFLMQDVQNSVDSTALLLRTGDPMSFVGYCPRFYSEEFSKLLPLVGASGVTVTVERVNPDAPAGYKLLCRLVSSWPTGFAPCCEGLYRDISTRLERTEPAAMHTARP